MDEPLVPSLRLHTLQPRSLLVRLRVAYGVQDYATEVENTLHSDASDLCPVSSVSQRKHGRGVLLCDSTRCCS